MSPAVGGRTLLAMTCSKCGELRPGDQFERYRRSPRDRIEYLTKRCRACRWMHMASSWGR